MRKFTQILNSKAHYIFEAEEIPDLPPDSEGNPIVFIDITEHSNVTEGMDYDKETNTFTTPAIPEIETIPNVIEEPAITANIDVSQLNMAIIEGLIDISERLDKLEGLL